MMRNDEKMAVDERSRRTVDSQLNCRDEMDSSKHVPSGGRNSANLRSRPVSAILFVVGVLYML